MKKTYAVKQKDGLQEFQIERHGDGRLSLIVGDKTSTFKILSQSDGRLTLQSEAGKVFSLSLQKQGSNFHVVGEGQNLALEVFDAKALRRAGGAGGLGAGSGEIKAPMPGRIVKVEVSEGDEVTEGQGLVVVEAMKMENEYKSPLNGVVKTVAVKEGDTVEAGTLLILVE